MNIAELLPRFLRCISKQLKYEHIRTISNNPLRPKKEKAKSDRQQQFVDWRKVSVRGGQGGNGACTFLRLWCNDKAGPDGGDGGHGGHVIFRANRNINSLNHLDGLYKAEDGEKGYSQDCHGKNGEHTVIEVPVGTIFKNASGQRVAELEDGEIFIAARGGAGGKGNHFFLSNEVREPLISEIGAKGEELQYTIELRVIAHVGLIGFPNAGKSTLLRAISRARPKVASYPFTTLNPHVGTVLFDDYEQISVADIPGLIPGAHKNRGLGISFLRHIERCLCLLYVIDLSQEEPWTQLETLKYELNQYQEGLADRPHAIIGNKIDLKGSDCNYAAMQERLQIPIIPISAKKGNNVTILLRHLREIYNIHVKEMKNSRN